MLHKYLLTIKNSTQYYRDDKNYPYFSIVTGKCAYKMEILS